MFSVIPLIKNLYHRCSPEVIRISEVNMNPKNLKLKAIILTTRRVCVQIWQRVKSLEILVSFHALPKRLSILLVYLHTENYYFVLFSFCTMCAPMYPHVAWLSSCMFR